MRTRFGFFLFLCSHCFLGHIRYFQIAYRTASDKFPGKLAELFLVLTDGHVTHDESGDSRPPPHRGTKHRMEDDQMSTGSGSKRQDLVPSAEKKGAKSKGSKFAQKKNK